MTLLEKLHLEPRIPLYSDDDRVRILCALSRNLNESQIIAFVRWNWHQPLNKTNAEFLTACEAWLAKN